MKSKRTWTRVASVPTPAVAHEYLALLEEHDVPVFLANEGQAGFSGVGATGVDVMVPANRLEEARGFLQAAPSANEAKGSVRCPSCGETSPATFGACWKCSGSLLDAERVIPTPEASPVEDRVAGTAPGEPEGPARSVAARQILLVLLVVVVPGIFYSRFWRVHEIATPFQIRLGTLAYQVAIVVLLVYLVRRGKETMTVLGLADIHWGKELFYAVPIGLFVLGVGTYSNQVAWNLGLEFDIPASGPPQRSLALNLILPFSLLAGALFEELVFRAFLWNRLRRVGVDALLALLICTALFTVGHGYMAAGLLGIFMMGLVLGFAFWRWGSLPRLVIAHAAINIWIYYASLVPQG